MTTAPKKTVGIELPSKRVSAESTASIITIKMPSNATNRKEHTQTGHHQQDMVEEKSWRPLK